jgi:uncharacterized protein YecT (DUF1311 family)
MRRISIFARGLTPPTISALLRRSAYGCTIETRTAKAERDLYQGGTAASPAYLACLEAMTRARTRELSIMYVVKLK